MAVKPRVLEILKESLRFISGGMGVHGRNLFPMLTDEYNVSVISLSHDQQSRIISDWNGVKLYEFGTEAYLIPYKVGLYEELRNVQTLMINWAKMFNGEKFDLIHLHDSQWFPLANFLRFVYKCPLVTTIHLNLATSHPAFPRSEIYQYIMNNEMAAYFYSDALMTVSHEYKRMLDKKYMFNVSLLDGDNTTRNLKVVSNGVNFEELRQVPVDKEAKRKYKGDFEKLVVFVGRLVWTKGVSHILEAADQLPRYKFVIISNVSPTMEHIVPLIADVRKYMETHDNLEWLNHCYDEPKWTIMKNADIGIMPSVHEPFGITALEWMSLGTPLIASSAGGLTDFCKGGFNSTVISPGSTIELVEALKNYEHNGKMVSNAVATAKKYTWKKVSNKVKNIYKSLIGE